MSVTPLHAEMNPFYPDSTAVVTGPMFCATKRAKGEIKGQRSSDCAQRSLAVSDPG
jgi:hypothetical protein